MVAPFLGPLKGWIKQQRRLDKQKSRGGAHLAPPVATGITDTELEVDLGETTADEAAIPEKQAGDGNFAELVANLGRSHRASDALPEVSAQPQTVDPAAELKRLLSVGSGVSPQQPQEAPALAQAPQQNPLMAMLQGNNRSIPPPQVPRTPFDQLIAPPQQPHSPHGQHHPRPPNLSHMPPPPMFPFQHPQDMPLRGPPYPNSPQMHNGFPMSIPPQFMPPPPRQVNPVFPSHAPNVPHSFNQQAPRPYQQTGDPQFAEPQFPGVHSAAAPPPSKLPVPKLDTHRLGLLNSFKMNEKPAISSPQGPSQHEQSFHSTPKTQQAPQPQPIDSFVSPPGLQSAHPYAPSPPAFQSPPPNANLQPVQPKPRSAHQDSLLNLFRSPSAAATTPPPEKSPEQPAELSAYPSTPGYPTSKPRVEAGPPLPDMAAKPNLLAAFASGHNKPGNTSATVRGPVNAPDFDTVKKNAGHPLNGHSRGPSPAGHLPPYDKVEQKMFIPQQILKREGTPLSLKSPITEVRSSPKGSPQTVVPSAAFKPQILKRTQQPGSQGTAQAPSAHSQGLLDLFKSQTPPQPVPAPAPANAPTEAPAPAAQTFDRRDTFPNDQKNALLSLFSKPSSIQNTASPTQPSRSPLAPVTGSPVPPARSPQPPTPKTLMSGVISPVSPLPGSGSQAESPANLNSRSRISSIGETIPPHVIIPQTTMPTSHPSADVMQKNGFGIGDEEVYMSPGELGMDKGKGKASADGKSPVDKTFLLGFLNDVARKGR